MAQPKKRPHRTKKSPQTTVQLGNSLERKVQSYYEALGYKVTRNVALDHHQIDMIASKYVAGGLMMTIMVECKHRGGTVGIDEITAFRNTATHLIQAQRITCAVMITNGSFTKEANGVAADSATIRLSTLDQLEQEVFNSTESLLRVIRDYETQAIHREFITLRGLDSNDSSVDILKFIENWAHAGEPLLLVVGDFGSGKTTLMERAHYSFSRARMDNPEKLFPILLRLRAFRRYPDLWSFIEASLRDNQYLVTARQVFETELRSGRLILFIDGFDEIHTGASADERGLYLSQLAPLLSSRSPCVVSTRPTYFDSFDAMLRSFRKALDRAPSLDRVPTGGIDLDRLLSKLDLHDDLKLSKEAFNNALRVQNLDRQQILRRLRKDEAELARATGMSIVEFRDWLLGIYDIEDLMKRPLLLKMIIETALSVDVDFFSDNAKHGPASLYELYTQMCATRDVKRAPESQYLTRKSRLDASRHIALAMFQRDRIQLQASEVREAIQQVDLQTISSATAALDTEGLDRALTDVRLCSFLKFEGDGTLAFTHKSYLEFFVAQQGYLASKLSTDELRQYSQMKLKREHLYFLGSFARDQVSFGDMLKLQLREADDPTYRSFLLRTIFAAGTLLDRIRLESGQVYGVDVRRVTLQDTTLHQLQLDKVSMNDVTATRLTVDSVNLVDTEIENCAFIDSRISVGGTMYKFHGVTTTGSRWRFGGNRFNVVNFQARATEVALDGQGAFSDVTISDSSTVVIQPSCILGDMSAITISTSTIIGLSTRNWLGDDARVVLKDCRLSAVHISLSDLFSGTLSLTNCSGVVILQADHHLKLDKTVRTRLRDQFPSIVFVDADLLQTELNALETRSPQQAKALLSARKKDALEEFKAVSSLLRVITDQRTHAYFDDSYLMRYFV